MDESKSQVLLGCPQMQRETFMIEDEERCGPLIVFYGGELTPFVPLEFPAGCKLPNGFYRGSH